MKYLTLLISLLFILSCRESRIEHPVRLPGIPEDSTWAGGPDGGSWFKCSKADKRKYYCIVYNENTGNVTSRGNYLLKRYSWDDVSDKSVFTGPGKQFKELSFNAYDGEFIYLSDSHILLPDGMIYYPFGDGHGKKVLYRAGSEIYEKQY